jgi:hypothetical protein
MRSLYLPLLPLPVLAAVVAFSACSSSHTDEPATRIVPPAAALAPAPAPHPTVAAAAPAPEDAPSEQEIREFERPVPK